MSRRSNSGLAPAILIGVLATVAIIGGAVVIASSGVLNDAPPPDITTNPTATPTASPTATPTASPTPSPTPTAKPTASPSPAPTASPTPSPSPSPSPTPEPVATAFQNATLTSSYDYVNHTYTWVVNGTLINSETSQGISGVTVTVVDATNSTLVYGTTVTDENGYLEFTLDVIQPSTLQLIFAGNEQYIAVTSDTIQMTY